MDRNKGYNRMALDGCGKFMKYAMFIVNFLIFILGVTILGLGIWSLTDTDSMSKVIGENFDNKLYTGSAAILLTFGGVVSFISFLGCCGAIKEVKCLLLTFFIVLLLITILIIIGAAFAFKVKGDIKKGFEEGVKKSMEQYNKADDMKSAWDEMQKKLKCCGAIGYADWKDIGLKTPPDSCNCEDPSKDKCEYSLERNVYKEGCAQALEDFIITHMQPLAIIGIVTAVIIVLAMVFSCSLFLMI